jgi:topoisomerase-4 subunit A
MVQIGQKNYLLTARVTGNILTGDSAAASRYIEARLSKFALKFI